jgi:hypothetical protein
MQVTSASSPDLAVQQRLNAHYLRELTTPEDFASVPSIQERAQLEGLETEWIEHEEKRCDLTRLPGSAVAFERWYRVRFEHQLQAARPFFQHLAYDASLEELALYVCFEEQVDGRFDEVIALAQIGLTGSAKIALARNYWEEMGEGRAEQMHTYLFAKSAAYFRNVLRGTPLASLLEMTSAAIKNGNILLLLALRRKYSARLLGALTLLEQTAPYRFSKTVEAMRRLNVPEDVVYYHRLHIDVDAKHGDDLLKEVVLPIVARRPDLIPEIATGVAMRCNIANDYYAELSSRMNLPC